MPGPTLTALADELDRTYQAVAARLPDNPAVRFDKVGDKQELVLSPLDKMDEPASLIALRAKVTGMLPRVDLPELILEIVDAAELGDGLGQPGRALADLERAHDSGGRNPAELERAGQAQHVVPMRLDILQADVVSRYIVEQPVVGVRIDPPETRAANIGQAWTESVDSLIVVWPPCCMG
jgi:hypothetical protein